MDNNLGQFERGIVSEVTEAGYIVESLDRNGLVTPPISPIHSQLYAVGEIVLFVLFRDGTGKIISLA